MILFCKVTSKHDRGREVDKAGVWLHYVIIVTIGVIYRMNTGLSAFTAVCKWWVLFWLCEFKFIIAKPLAFPTADDDFITHWSGYKYNIMNIIMSRHALFICASLYLCSISLLTANKFQRVHRCKPVHIYLNNQRLEIYIHIY